MGDSGGTPALPSGTAVPLHPISSESLRFEECVVGLCEGVRRNVWAMDSCLTLLLRSAHRDSDRRAGEKAMHEAIRSLIEAVGSAESELRGVARGVNVRGRPAALAVLEEAEVGDRAEADAVATDLNDIELLPTMMDSSDSAQSAKRSPHPSEKSYQLNNFQMKAESSTSLPARAQPRLGRRMSLTEHLAIDTLLSDENDSSKITVNGVFNPNWPGRLTWDLLVILLVLVDSMVLPFQFAYKEDTPDEFDSAWTIITTCFFGFDIIMSFCTAYTEGTKEGKLVTDWRAIAKNYLRSWFPIDFASTIPWGALANAISGGDASQTAQMAKSTKIVKFVRFLRLMRMLRLAKLAMIWERVEAHLGSVILKQSVALLRVIVVLAGICHWNACVWWMVGQPTSLFTSFMSEEEQASFAEMRHWTTVPRGNVGEEWTWLERSRSEQYIFCFYWTLGVMRTMPAEVTPENQPERLYVMIFMFFAFSAFAICVALITQTFFKFSERKRMFDDDMAQVRMYMRDFGDGVGASDKVQASVKGYLKHLFDTRKMHAKENTILGLLPPHLRSKLKYERLAPKLQKLGILKNLPQKAAFYVNEICEIRDVAAGTCISKRGTWAESCWVLVTGRLVWSPHTSPEYITQGIVDEECLRNLKPVRSEYTVAAVQAAELIQIDKAAFMQIVCSHEDFKAYLSFLDQSPDHAPSEPQSPTSQRQRAELDSMATTAVILS